VQTETVTIFHSINNNLVFLLLLRRFVVWMKTSENYDFFPQHYIPLLFHRPTASSTTPLHTTQTRYMSASQPATSKQTSSGALLPTGRAEIYVYPWLCKSTCDGVWYFVAVLCSYCSIGPQK